MQVAKLFMSNNVPKGAIEGAKVCVYVCVCDLTSCLLEKGYVCMHACMYVYVCMPSDSMFSKL
jgi:hypothetical protein